MCSKHLNYRSRRCNLVSSCPVSSLHLNGFSGKLVTKYVLPLCYSKLVNQPDCWLFMITSQIMSNSPCAMIASRRNLLRPISYLTSLVSLCLLIRCSSQFIFIFCLCWESSAEAVSGLLCSRHYTIYLLIIRVTLCFQLLVDWTRGKNLIISSAASSVTELRGPYDAANLSLLLGLSMEHAKAAVSRNCRYGNLQNIHPVE